MHNVGLRIYNIFLLVLEDIVYSPEVFCLANGILSVLFIFCYTYMGLGAQLLKTQDNIPICASIIGQKLALHSLELGPEWVKERV